MDKKIIAIVGLCILLFACNKQDKNELQYKEPIAKSVASVSQTDSVELQSLTENPSVENHMKAMGLIFGIPKHNIRSIGILVYDGVNDLDLFGPRYVLGQAMGAKTELISIKPGNIKTAQGIELTPNTVIDDVKKLDMLVIPGGFKGTAEEAYNNELHDWIQQIDQTTTYTASVCTGGCILGETGLLKGKKASTNLYNEKHFLTKHGAIPAIQRYTKAGKYWTSTGVTAGMDMCIAILKDIYGHRYAQAVMLDMEYDPNPPVEGRTPERTEWSLNWMIQTMYDGALTPLIDSMENTSP